MPKQVDHDARRRAVADVTADLIADGGLEAVTVRDVARAAGYSTAIVSHYFSDKRELLAVTFRRAAARELMDAPLRACPTNLRGALEALLPLSERRLRDWKVYIAFWGGAVAEPDLARQQRDRARAIRARLAAVLRAMQDETLIGQEVDTEATARLLLGLVVGIASQAVFDPDGWPPRQQRAAVADALRRLGLAAA